MPATRLTEAGPANIYIGFRHPITREPTDPLPAQAAFLSSYAKHRGLFGGYGSGKSVVGGMAANIECELYPDNLGIIGRRIWNDLRDSTMEVFFREVLPVERNPFVGDKKADGKCRWVATSKDLIYPNGSKIMFRHMDDPSRYLSEELGWFYLDEGIETGMEYAYKVLSSRLRRGRASRRGWTTSNPGPKSSWLHRKFIEGMKRDPQSYFAVSASSLENRYLPRDYLGELMEYPDEEFQMYVMGQFIAAQGAIFPKFRRDVHVVRPFEIPEEWPKLRAIDVGISHPFVCLWLAVDEFNRAIYAYREWVATDLDLDQQCQMVHGLSVGEKYLHTVIDPATQARVITGGMPVIDQVRMYLDNVIPGFNDVDAGITRIRTLLNWNVDQAGNITRRPMLYFFNTCPTAIDQVEALQYDVKKGVSTGKPVNRDDDTVDALKYGVQSIGGFEGFQVEEATPRDTIQGRCRKQAEQAHGRKFRGGRGRKSWRDELIEREVARQQVSA